MDQDPLKQRLEDVLPLDKADKVLQVPADIPASIEAICTALSNQDGIEGVTLGRQVGQHPALNAIVLDQAVPCSPMRITLSI